MRAERLAGGLAVLLIGLMFLLANSGLIDLSAWRLVLRFWPVLLILAGVVVLVGLSFRWFVVIVLLLAIAAGAFGGPWLDSFAEGRLTTEIFEPPEAAGPVTSIVAELALDAPRVRVSGPVAEPYRIELSYRNAGLPQHSFSVGGDGHGLLSLDQHRTSSSAGARQIAVLAFSGEPELDLRFKTGAMSGDLDLRPYRVRRLTIDGGAVHVKVQLGATRGRVTVEAGAGVGSFTFVVPEEVGLRVFPEFGIGIKQLSQAGLRRVGAYWEDELWATADRSVEIRVSGGIGRISITRD